MNKKEREQLLKSKFNCKKGDVVIFMVDKKKYKGEVIDLVPKYELPCNYLPEKIPDSRDKTCMWEDEKGALDSVLLCIMTGKKRNLPSYYTSINIIIIIVSKEGVDYVFERDTRYDGNEWCICVECKKECDSNNL